ncbi:MAG: hypothetical protein MUF04_07915 [Akkermansiaceae bacterium]|nr:hypothetical protein [Akkermansiaceae bacterium]
MVWKKARFEDGDPGELRIHVECGARLLVETDLRIELENERQRQASSLQKSKFNNHQSEINPDFAV